MNRPNRIAAVILGSADNAYYMLCSLSDSSYETILIIEKDVPAARFPGARLILCHHADKQQLLELLNDLADSYPQLLLVPTADEYAVAIAELCHQFKKNISYSSTSPEQIRKCANKIAFSELCRQANIAAPHSYVFESADHYMEQKNQLQYPLVIKPAHARQIKKSILRKVARVDDEAAFLALAHQIWDSGLSVFCQEYIPGDQQSIYFAGGIVDAQQRFFKCFIGKKLLEYPLVGGVTVKCIAHWNQEVFDTASQLLKALDYQGMIDIEFKQDARDGRFKIIEANPRMGQWHPISRHNQLDIVTAFLLTLTDSNYTETLADYQAHHENRNWVYPHYCLIALIEKHGIVSGGLRWCLSMLNPRRISSKPVFNFPRWLFMVRVVLGRCRQLGVIRLLFPRPADPF